MNDNITTSEKMDCQPRGRRGRGGRGNRNEEVGGETIIHSLCITPLCLHFNEFVISVLCVFQSRDVRLSKSLTYVLRHGANKMGFQMNSGEK